MISLLSPQGLLAAGTQLLHITGSGDNACEGRKDGAAGTGNAPCYACGEPSKEVQAMVKSAVRAQQRGPKKCSRAKLVVKKPKCSRTGRQCTLQDLCLHLKTENDDWKTNHLAFTGFFSQLVLPFAALLLPKERFVQSEHERCKRNTVGENGKRVGGLLRGQQGLVAPGKVARLGLRPSSSWSCFVSSRHLL